MTTLLLEILFFGNGIFLLILNDILNIGFLLNLYVYAINFTNDKHKYVFFPYSILQVRDVLTKFRGLGKSEDAVSEWLKSCGITNSEHKRDIYRCLKRIDDSN